MTREELAHDVLLALIAQGRENPPRAVHLADELLAALKPPQPPAESDRAAKLLAHVDEFKRRREIYDAAEQEYPPAGSVRYRGSKYLEALWSWACQADSMLAVTAHGVQLHWPQHIIEHKLGAACRLDDPQPRREDYEPAAPIPSPDRAQNVCADCEHLRGEHSTTLPYGCYVCACPAFDEGRTAPPLPTELPL